MGGPVDHPRLSDREGPVDRDPVQPAKQGELNTVGVPLRDVDIIEVHCRLVLTDCEPH